MSAYVEYTSVFVYPVYAFVYLPPQYPELPVKRQRFRYVSVEQRLFHVVEYPWIAYGGSTYHHPVDSVSVEGFHQSLRCCYVTVAYYRNVQPWILLYACYHLPVGFAGIHLRTGTAMDCYGLYAAVL